MLWDAATPAFLCYRRICTLRCFRMPAWCEPGKMNIFIHSSIPRQPSAYNLITMLFLIHLRSVGIFYYLYSFHYVLQGLRNKTYISSAVSSLCIV